MSESFPHPETTPREIFMRALKEELSMLVKTGRISPEQADTEYTEASSIDTSSFENPLYEARVLALRGRASNAETEQLSLWHKKMSAEAQQKLASELKLKYPK